MILKIRFLSMIILLLFLFFSTAVPQTIVETLPGYPGPLPFKLETGYIDLDEDDDVHLFYYFIESEGDPVKDPLVLWLTGGPGCSGLSNIVYEIGPLRFEAGAIDPSFVLNPYSWTKAANIIFIDSPPGTGFSYATTTEGYNNSDTKVVEQLYVFLQKWLLKHPNFIKNRLYISGSSYGGKWVPLTVFRISKGNEAGDKPRMALEGYTMGNPTTDEYFDVNSQVPFAHRLGLISDEHYKMAKFNCKENYANPNPANKGCLHALQHFRKCTDRINMLYILYPCYPIYKSQEELGVARRFLGDESTTITIPPTAQRFGFRCDDKDYRPVAIWTNDPTVQEALQVRKGTVGKWRRCNDDLTYDRNVKSTIPYHDLLSKKGYKALVYSGDHDMAVPHFGTLGWIRQLNLTLVDDWRPWFVQDQSTSQDEIAGYTEKYVNIESRYNITFATVKGAGHTAPDYKPKECQAMFKRFISHNPL